MDVLTRAAAAAKHLSAKVTPGGDIHRFFTTHRKATVLVAFLVVMAMSWALAVRAKGRDVSVNGVRLGMSWPDALAAMTSFGYTQVIDNQDNIVGKSESEYVNVELVGTVVQVTARGGGALEVGGATITTQDEGGEGGSTARAVWDGLGRPDMGSASGDFLYYSRGDADVSIFLKNAHVSFVEVANKYGKWGLGPHPEQVTLGYVRGRDLSRPAR